MLPKASAGQASHVHQEDGSIGCGQVRVRAQHSKGRPSSAATVRRRRELIILPSGTSGTTTGTVTVTRNGSKNE